MMITIQNPKLFGILFWAMGRKKICLVFLLCHIFCIASVNSPESKKTPSENDSLSTSIRFSAIGEIKVQGGATIVGIDKYSASDSQKNTPKNKFVLKGKIKTLKSETPVRIQIDIAKSSKVKLVPSTTSGVSFSNNAQNNRAIAQVDFGKLFLLKTEKAISNSLFSLGRELKTGSFSDQVRHSSFRLTFCTRPPPFLSNSI